MNFENEIFKKTRIDFKKLKKYGFKKEGNIYVYQKKFMDNFRAIIEINENEEIFGRIYDINVAEEYINYRIESQIGQFVRKVREEYKNILIDIKENCSIKCYFFTNQANRIAEMIHSVYHDEPEFAWEKYPDFGIFKNPQNKKWYGLVFNIDISKLDKNSRGKVEAINIKVSTNKIPKLLKQKGFFPAYHMNKKNWLTIVLDDTLKDEEIFSYIKESHKYTETLNEWVIPANPKFYDVMGSFNTIDTITWKQAKGIKNGDIVYIYITSPWSAIIFKCEVVETNIAYTYSDITINKAMKIKLIEKFDKEQYPLLELQKYGIKSIRGPRRITPEFSKKINGL